MSTPWGQARVEIEKLRDEISEELGSGCSVKSIYSGLKTAGRLSITYKAFRVCVNNTVKRGKSLSVISRGLARIEVISLRSRIRASLTNGRTLKSMYDELKAEGLVSSSYRGFYKNVRKYCGSSWPRVSRPQPALPSAQSGTTAPSRAPEAVSKPSPTPPASPPPVSPPAVPHPKHDFAADFKIQRLSEEELN